MEEASDEGNEIISLNEETRVALPESTAQNGFGRELVPAERENGLALSNPFIPVDVPNGTFNGATFGPQTNKKVVEDHKYDYNNARITHITHNNYYGTDKEKPNGVRSTPSPSGSNEGDRPDSRESTGDCTKLSDSISMFNEKPLIKGTRIFKGIQTLVVANIKRMLAIKLVPFESLKEVQNLLKLAPHPNVVQIIDSQMVCPCPTREIYIAMDLFPSNLQQYINENREKRIPFNFEQTMLLTKQLLAGVNHAHQNGIIHGDIKPTNILLSEDQKQLKVGDFGLSKEVPHGRSVMQVSGNAQGTNNYLAPETLESNEISRHSDIFNLGITMFGLWSNGKHPFGSDPLLRDYNIKNNKGRDFSGVLLAGPKKVQFVNLIKKMLHPNPLRRPTIEQISQHAFFSSTPVSVSGAANGYADLRSAGSQSLPEEALPLHLNGEPHLSERTFNATDETVPKQGYMLQASRRTSPLPVNGNVETLEQSQQRQPRKKREAQRPRVKARAGGARTHRNNFGSPSDQEGTSSSTVGRGATPRDRNTREPMLVDNAEMHEITVVVGNKRISLEVDLMESVENVKKMLEQRDGYIVDEQRLVYRGREIVGGRLNHHGIRNHSVLWLHLESIQIFVNDFEGRTRTFDVHSSDSVDDLKVLVRQKTSVLPSQQILVHEGRQLQTGRSLSEYNIHRHSTIHLTGRLKGGAFT